MKAFTYLIVEKDTGKWFTSPDGMTPKLFSQNDEIPSGWVPGMKLKSKIEKTE
jgi:hypothetical protein